MRKQLTYKDVESSDDYYFICGGKQKGSLSYYVDKNHLFCDKFGKKSKKKYFSYRSGWKYFWEPCMKDVSRIERVYFKILKRLNTINIEVEKLISKITSSRVNLVYNEDGQRIKIAHIKRYLGEDDEYGYYQFFKEDGGGYEYNCTPCKFTPKKLFLADLGTKLSILESRRNSLNASSARIMDLLKESILTMLKTKINKNNRMFISDIIINERKYVAIYDNCKYKNESKLYPAYNISSGNGGEFKISYSKITV